MFRPVLQSSCCVGHERCVPANFESPFAVSTGVLWKRMSRMWVWLPSTVHQCVASVLVTRGSIKMGVVFGEGCYRAMLTVLVIYLFLGIWRYSVWYDLDRTITVYGAVVIVNATATYLVEDACGAPPLPLAFAGVAGFVVAALKNGLPLSSFVVLLLATLGTWAFAPSCYLTFGACTGCVLGLWVYTIRH